MHYRLLPTPFPMKGNISADNSYHNYGYENPHDFLVAVTSLHARYHGYIGEAVADRHGFIQLRFDDIEAHPKVWFPRFMLQPAPAPLPPEEEDPTEQLLNEIWGFN